MSEESFLSRWSRRKRTPPAAEPEVPALDEPGPEDGEAAEAVPPDLPPIETLDAGSDYTAFLQPNVPAALRSAALRRAWVADAGIANFRGMADYDWDFNAPGYGKFLAVDDVAKLADAVFGPAPAAEAEAASGDPVPSRPALMPVESAAVAAAAPELGVLPEEEAPSPRQPRDGGDEESATAAAGETAPASPAPAEEAPPPSRRRHGGAKPL